jgi:hypothetical protein
MSTATLNSNRVNAFESQYKETAPRRYVSGFRFQVSGASIKVSGVRFQVSGGNEVNNRNFMTPQTALLPNSPSKMMIGISVRKFKACKFCNHEAYFSYVE